MRHVKILRIIKVRSRPKFMPVWIKSKVASIKDRIMLEPH